MTLRPSKSTPPASDMHATLRRLLDSTRDVVGMSGLSQDQTRFLYAALLASIITADKKVHHGELELYARLLTQKLNLPEGALEAMADFITHGLNAQELALTSAALRDLLDIEKRIELVGLLWQLAASDADLHLLEEEQVHHIAEMIGVTALRTIAEKMSFAPTKTAIKP